MKFEALRFRVARPTNRLQAIRTFYCDVLGLEELGSFRDHAGYDGIMIGIPDREYHLEFTSLAGGNPSFVSSKDHLLVFYMPNRDSIHRIEERLRSNGHAAVPPENPYWEGRSLTFEDPDGWRVVFVDSEAA